MSIEQQLDAYHKSLSAAWQMLKRYGWYPFGYHAYQSPVPALEFSDLKDEDGDPWFERVVNMSESLQRGLEQAARGESRELPWVLNNPCPECGTQLVDSSGGGVNCPSENCAYWFCY